MSHPTPSSHHAAAPSQANPAPQPNGMEILRALEARIAQQEQQIQAHQAGFNAAVASAVAAQLGQLRADRAVASPAQVVRSQTSAKARAPEPFSGLVSTSAPDQVDRWISEMERYLSVTDAEEGKRVSIAATYLSKNAAKWYNARSVH